MIVLLILQLTVPLLFIAWVAIAPLRSAVGFCLQAAAAAASLVAMALIGIGTFPPWWTAYAYGVLLIAAVAFAALKRRSFPSIRPVGAWQWSALAVALALGVFATLAAAAALSGRTPPAGRVLDLPLPLPSGRYLVVNGGNDPRVNAHLKTLDASVPRFRAWRGQSHGVDLVRIDRFGLRANGVLPADPAAYRIYGTPVTAPCEGEIVAAVDHLPDMRPPQVDRSHRAGNHVVIRCRDADILLAHLRPGSVQVATGHRVRLGERLGAVGNSGSSDEPHLHIHAQTRGTAAAPFSGVPIPIRFDGRFVVRNDRISPP